MIGSTGEAQMIRSINERSASDKVDERRCDDLSTKEECVIRSTDNMALGHLCQIYWHYIILGLGPSRLKRESKFLQVWC